MVYIYLKKKKKNLFKKARPYGILYIHITMPRLSLLPAVLTPTILEEMTMRVYIECNWVTNRWIMRETSPLPTLHPSLPPHLPAIHLMDPLYVPPNLCPTEISHWWWASVHFPSLSHCLLPCVLSLYPLPLPLHTCLSFIPLCCLFSPSHISGPIVDPGSLGSAPVLFR